MAEKPSINLVCDLPEFIGPLGHEQPRNLDIAAHREEAGRGHPLFRELTAPTGSPAAPGSSIPKQRRPSIEFGGHERGAGAQEGGELATALAGVLRFLVA